jgi:hypothetical protein
MLEPAQEPRDDVLSRPKEAQTAPVKPARPAAAIEITPSNGCRLQIDQHVDARALRRIVDVLRG